MWGVTSQRLKLSKSTFCSPEVKWFGRVFSNMGYSADPDKLAFIVEAGRPTSIEDMRSFLQACSYNAKFTFDHSQPQTYQEITAPLREMLEKGAKFEWTKIRERSYQSLIEILSDKTTLRPFLTNLPTHFKSDACRLGISASVYQEEKGETWSQWTMWTGPSQLQNRVGACRLSGRVWGSPGACKCSGLT